MQGWSHFICKCASFKKIELTYNAHTNTLQKKKIITLPKNNNNNNKKKKTTITTTTKTKAKGFHKSTSGYKNVFSLKKLPEPKTYKLKTLLITHYKIFRHKLAKAFHNIYSTKSQDFNWHI